MENIAKLGTSEPNSSIFDYVTDEFYGNYKQPGKFTSSLIVEPYASSPMRKPMKYENYSNYRQNNWINHLNTEPFAKYKNKQPPIHHFNEPFNPATNIRIENTPLWKLRETFSSQSQMSVPQNLAMRPVYSRYYTQTIDPMHLRPRQSLYRNLKETFKSNVPVTISRLDQDYYKIDNVASFNQNRFTQSMRHKNKRMRSKTPDFG